MIEKRLKQLRIKAGLSVPELAKKTKLSVTTIYNVEAGRFRWTRRSTIAKLAKVLDLNADESPAPPEIRAESPAPVAPRLDMKWLVILMCPKCESFFRISVSEGTPDPNDRGIACPSCGFCQIISLRRGS